ncbi:protein kinase domain-containing protein [Piscinibacter sakaiensis]|uniref:protein kinase domain-containing protein n=1 Tax=Piscinibacter sakaiensis TaxID=1547922 RepID=UPI003AB0857E
MNKPADRAADDATVIRPAGVVTMQPGTGPVVGNALPLGTLLGEYELTGVIGEGGFGIVYLATDRALERVVAIKEYMPADLAERDARQQLACLSADDEPLFRRGLLSFITEAKILARFDHPSLLKVYRFWEANGTAYMVMPFYEGPTLHDELRRLRGPADEAWLRRLLDPLTHALAVIHDADIYHRDIAPDNIVLLEGSGRPVLLDFGAARKVINDASQKAPTAIVKPGYAPIEQYSDIDLKQGPWSDVYALAAVLHLAITGEKPPAAIARLAGDACVPLVSRAAGHYSTRFLAAIDRALIVRPDERTPDMAALRADLGLPPLQRDGAGRLVVAEQPAGVRMARPDDAGEQTVQRPEPSQARQAAPPVPPMPPMPPVEAAAPATTDAVRPDSRRLGWMLGAVGSAAAALLLGGFWWAWTSTAVPPSRPAPATAAPTVAASPPALPALPPTRSAPPDTRPAGSAITTAPVATPSSALPPFDVADQFERIQAQSAPGRWVALQLKSRGVFGIASQDLLAMDITSSDDGYLYVLAHTPDGVLLQYFPNALSPDNFIRKRTVQAVPRTVTDPASKQVHAGLVLTDPPGRGNLLVLVSRHPRDFSLLGTRREAIYPRYPTGPEAALLDLQLGGAGRPLYLGQPRCPPRQPCLDEFWATAASFDIVP